MLSPVLILRQKDFLTIFYYIISDRKTDRQTKTETDRQTNKVSYRQTNSETGLRTKMALGLTIDNEKKYNCCGSN